MGGEGGIYILKIILNFILVPPPKPRFEKRQVCMVLSLFCENSKSACMAATNKNAQRVQTSHIVLIPYLDSQHGDPDHPKFNQLFNWSGN